MTKSASINKSHKENWIDKRSHEIIDALLEEIKPEAFALFEEIMATVKGHQELVEAVEQGVIDKKFLCSIRSFSVTSDRYVSRGSKYSGRMKVEIEPNGLYFNSPTSSIFTSHYADECVVMLCSDTLDVAHGKKLITKSDMNRINKKRRQVVKRIEQAWGKHDEFRLMANSVLERIRNTKSLKATWPEISDEFLKLNPISDNPNKPLPVVVSATLNSYLEIGKEVSQAA